jgi:hypothetical protein
MRHVVRSLISTRTDMTKLTVAFAPARLNKDEELCQWTALLPPLVSFGLIYPRRPGLRV